MLLGVRRARRARGPVARHAALDLPRGGARARARPGRRGRSSRRGWRRGRAALARVRRRCSPSVFALVLVTAGPVWDQIVEFVHALPALLGRARSKPDWFQDILSTARRRRQGPRSGSRTSPRGCRTPRARCSASRAACSARSCSLVTLTFLALFLLMERPTITDWLFGFTPPGGRARAGGRCVEDSISRGVLVADRQRRDLGRRRPPSPACRRGLLGLPFPIVLAVITGLLDLIPQVGATIAAVILVAVALTVEHHRGGDRCW